jgi:hypothetical protein
MHLRQTDALAQFSLAPAVLLAGLLLGFAVGRQEGRWGWF